MKRDEGTATGEPAPRVTITGGEGALATAIADRFAADGWEVLRPGRRELDVSDAAAVEAWFRCREVPDLLVCAAGLTRDKPLARLSPADWDAVMEANLHGAARCARAVARGMLRRRGGHMVLVSSHSAWHPPPGQAAYAAAKAGLSGLARSLARELGPAGVRVNLLVPGFLDTPMTRRLSPERIAAVRAQHLLGRFNGVEQAAEFVHFLHHRLPHTSGQVFHLDSRIV